MRLALPTAVRTLGVKVAVVIAVTAALVAAVIGALVHRQMADDLLSSARRGLDGQLVRAVEDYAAGRKPDARLDPTDLPTPVEVAIRHGRRVTYLQNTQAGPEVWAATMVSDRNVLAISRPYEQETRDLHNLDASLLTAAMAATTVALAVGLGLGVRVGRRATSAARTAERIAEGDLDARVRPAGRDEIARLASSVDTMAAALGARLEAERRVTADIAHELRTPVAGMITAADVLPPSRPAQLVQERSEALRLLVEDVLEVARLDAGAGPVQTEPCLLDSLARRAVARLGDDAEDIGVEVLEGGAGVVVETDPRRVERIIANLVLNALRHGSAPVTVEIRAGTVRVRDRGPGYPPELLTVLRTSGPQRFRTGSSVRGHGTGLGLTIAVGQARVLGARLDFANHPDGGAEVEVDLRQAVGQS
ncbi:HAMP domain-containing sensor histidine kinase [Streptomyces sp. NPDC051572]